MFRGLGFWLFSAGVLIQGMQMSAQKALQCYKTEGLTEKDINFGNEHQKAAPKQSRFY